MTSIVALTLCTVFVLFLLRLDRKQFPKASLSLWIPTLWMLFICSKSLTIWFGADDGKAMEEGSSIDRFFLILILFAGLVIIIKRKLDVYCLLRKNKAIILLVGFMLISITWSDMPLVSFKRWVRQLIPIVMALVIASEYNPRQCLQCIFRRMIYILMPFSYILIHYYPRLGVNFSGWNDVDLQWVGVTTQKNGLTFLCTFSLLYFAWIFIKRRQGRDNLVVRYQKYIEIFILFLSIYLFMGPNHTPTYSSTALGTLLIGLITMVGLLWLKKINIRMSSKALTIGIVAIIIWGTYTPFMGRLPLFDLSGLLNRETNLTGRSLLWDDLIPYAMEKPILGHGFGGFWTNERRDRYIFPAHNGYLDTILGTGFIGLFFFSIFLISNFRKAQQFMTRDFDWAILWLSFLLITMARNITESMNSLSASLPAIMIFLSISFSSKNSTNK